VPLQVFLDDWQQVRRHRDVTHPGRARGRPDHRLSAHPGDTAPNVDHPVLQVDVGSSQLDDFAVAQGEPRAQMDREP
jgi:hypothetical protein